MEKLKEDELTLGCESKELSLHVLWRVLEVVQPAGKVGGCSLLSWDVKIQGIWSVQFIVHRRPQPPPFLIVPVKVSGSVRGSVSKCIPGCVFQRVMSYIEFISGSACGCVPGTVQTASLSGPISGLFSGPGIDGFECICQRACYGLS